MYFGSHPIQFAWLFTGSWQSPYFISHDIYRILISSLSFSICMIHVFWQSPFVMQFAWLFTASWQSPFFNSHDIYRILTVSLFKITWYMYFGSLPFSTWMIFTGPRHSPFFDLHDPFNYRTLTCTVSLFWFIHVIYRIFTWVSGFL